MVIKKMTSHYRRSTLKKSLLLFGCEEKLVLGRFGIIKNLIRLSLKIFCVKQKYYTVCGILQKVI